MSKILKLKKYKIKRIDLVKAIGKKYSQLKRRYLHCFDYSKTALALDKETLSEDEMNDVDTAAKRLIEIVTDANNYVWNSNERKYAIWKTKEAN